MSVWYQRGNQRRFHRLDMPIKLLVLPKDRPRGKPIFHWGIDYFPPSVEVEIRTCRQLLKEHISQIQAHQDLMQALFFEAMAQIEFFGELTRMIAFGEHPLCQAQNLHKFKSFFQGFDCLQTIFEPAPRTYELFKEIEDKNKQMLQAVYRVLHQASSSKITTCLPSDFKIDQSMMSLQANDSKNDQYVPLREALIKLVDYQNLYYRAWQEMMLDLQWERPPKQWQEQVVNVSTGGVALKVPKRFPPLSHVNLKLYFPRIGVLEFEGSVVMQKSMPNEGKERIAINFEFPTQAQQIALRTEMELFELQSAVEVFT